MSDYYGNGCVQMPGPVANTGYSDGKPNTNNGVVCHSSEGDWSDTYGPVDTMKQRGLSWHFSVFKSGRVEQHFGIKVVTWHGGNRPINECLIGIEHEGVAGEPLTLVQLAASIALVKWCGEQGGWPLVRHQSLWEHNEVVGQYSPNAGPTTCPNGRIPWDEYTKEEDMTLIPLSDTAKVKLGLALGGDNGVFHAHFGDLVNQSPGDGYDVQLADDPTSDVVVFRLPKGPVTA